MTWSYDLSKLNEGGKDAVRFYVEDTDGNDQLVQDEEIVFALQGAGVYRAAEIICRKISAKYSRQANVNNKDSGIVDDVQEKAKHFLTLADKYAEQASRAGLLVFAGGISQSEATGRDLDGDRTPSAFRLDLHTSVAGPGSQPQ